MKIKKSVSEKVIAANRINAQQSTGPSNVTAVRHNAVKHGLLAKQIIFRTEEEKSEFKVFVDALEQEFKPEGMLERMLVEEIGVCWWKLQIALGWELREIRNRRKASKAVARALIQESVESEFPLFQDEGGFPSATRLNWDCDELVVERTSRESDRSKDDYGEEAEKNGRVEIEAKLNNSMETILRYEIGLKRDLYKAIHVLQDLQARRSEVSRATRGAPRKGPRSKTVFAKQSH